MWFISLVLKNLWRRKIRSVLTGTSMAIAVCAVISMLGMAEGFEKSFAALYEARGTDLVIMRAGITQRIVSRIDESLAERIRKISGVRAVEGCLIDLISPEGLQGVYVFGVDPGSVLLEDSKMRQGRRLTDQDQRKAMMGEFLARRLNRKIGDSIDIGGEPFEIVAIFSSFNMLENNGAVVSLHELQKAIDEKGKVTTFLIMLEDSYKRPDKVEEVRQQIEALRSSTGGTLNLAVQTTQDHVKTNFETQILKGLAWVSSMIAMIIGFVSMLNTMMMSITERIREIATFRALGWRKLRIMRMIFLESLVLSGIGAGLGVLLAVPLMEFLSAHSVTSTMVVCSLSPAILGQGVGMGMLAGLLGAIYPAWIAANLSPATALRHE